jgi:hypothetical protein
MAISTLASPPLDEVGDLHKHPVAVPVFLGKVPSS